MIDRPDQNQGEASSVTALPQAKPSRALSADGVLTASTIFWFVVAATGQAFFAIYIALFYGGASLRGDVQAWNEVVPGRVVAGDMVGFLAMAAHVALAFVVTVAGPLQLIPRLRARLPALHRWTGRVYVGLGFIISLGGLYLIWGGRHWDGCPGVLAATSLMTACCARLGCDRVRYPVNIHSAQNRNITYSF